MPLEPNGLAVGVIPAFATKPETFLARWWPQQLLDSLTTPPLLMPRQVQLAGSLDLLMAYLANPSEALWQGMAQQFCLAQASPLAIESPELMAAADALQLGAHVQEWQEAGPSRRVGQHLMPAPGLQIHNLVDMGLHERRHPAASFRAVHFDPEAAGSEKQQQAAWREWLRQGNLFQFLPHLLLSTPGWGGSEEPAVVDPPQVWVAPESSTAGEETSGMAGPAAAERQRAWRELGRFAPPALQPLLEALEAAWNNPDLALPEQAFELEGPRSDVLAQAELAWVDQHLAVVSDPVDAEAFTAVGWRCWLLDDPPAATAAALREALTPHSATA
jgi:DEAD/DEAH box helicase domain-containing protein